MVVLGQYGAKSLNMEKENLWWHRRTDQKGEYSAICLFEGWKIEHRNLGTIRLVSEEKSLSSVIYAKDPHLVADIFKVCSILTPPHPISRGRLRASKPAWIKPPVNLSYLSVFLYKIVGCVPADCQLHQKNSCWLRWLVDYHHVWLLLSESHVLGNSTSFRSANKIQQ